MEHTGLTFERSHYKSIKSADTNRWSHQSELVSSRNVICRLQVNLADLTTTYWLRTPISLGLVLPMKVRWHLSVHNQSEYCASVHHMISYKGSNGEINGNAHNVYKFHNNSMELRYCNIKQCDGRWWKNELAMTTTTDCIVVHTIRKVLERHGLCFVHAGWCRYYTCRFIQFGVLKWINWRPVWHSASKNCWLLNLLWQCRGVEVDMVSMSDYIFVTSYVISNKSPLCCIMVFSLNAPVHCNEAASNNFWNRILSLLCTNVNYCEWLDTNAGKLLTCVPKRRGLLLILLGGQVNWCQCSERSNQRWIFDYTTK